jgi:hypothetical protein
MTQSLITTTLLETKIKTTSSRKVARPVVGLARSGKGECPFLNSCEYFRMKPDALKHPDNLR